MENGNGKARGTVMTAEEYLGHLAFVYASSPAETPEESVAKALLELACERLSVDPQEIVASVMRMIPGGRFLPPWEAGTGVPADLTPGHSRECGTAYRGCAPDCAFDAARSDPPR